jgi:hypothetical protein
MSHKFFLATVLLFVALAGLSTVATADCVYSKNQQQSWHNPADTHVAPASFLLLTGKQGADDRIVGFWKVKFELSDRTVIDNGFAQWHSDGTEIMNSSRQPATGNFCLGVWEKSGPSSYKLNHFALAYDLSGNFIGPAQLREDVTLDQAGTHYAGSFTIDQYDPSGTLIAHIEGQVTGKRISLSSTIQDVL